MKTAPLLASVLLASTSAVSAAPNRPQDATAQLEKSGFLANVLPVLQPSAAAPQPNGAPHNAHRYAQGQPPSQRRKDNMRTPTTQQQLSLHPLTRNPTLKALAKGLTHPLQAAIQESARLLQQHPNLAHGHLTQLVPNTVDSVIDTFFVDRVEDLLDKYMADLVDCTTPEGRYFNAVAKEAIAYGLVIFSMTAVKNALADKPLLEGALPAFLLTLPHILLSTHVKQQTDNRVHQILAKIMVPALLSAHLAKSQQQKHNTPLNTNTYAASSALVTALSVGLYEGLKTHIPARAQNRHVTAPSGEQNVARSEKRR